MRTSSLVFTGIAPHPPIMVPEVGRESIEEVRGSIEAMRDFTERIVESGAETVVLVSPHAPLDARAFVAYEDAQLYGDFSNFRAPEARVESPLDEGMLQAITREAGREGYEVLGIKGYELDHGTAVPLYFLLRNGWHGRVVALGYSFLSNEDHLRFGSCIKRAADTEGRPTAFVASGDLSHRLKPEAPAGFNPEAHLFDEEVVGAIRDDQLERIAQIDQGLRRLAGECGFRSMLVALGAAEDLEHKSEVLSYEAPFGVGYLVAQISRGVAVRAEEDEGGRAEAETYLEEEGREGGHELLKLARSAVETFVTEGRVIDPPASDSPLLGERAACFVSLKTAGGDLRGCIGTIEPSKDTLKEEVIANAVSSATRDPRFLPVAAGELARLRYSVDVLTPPESTEFDQLDPKVYGVIVEDARGLRRGLLLPDLDGVDTARKQVEIAARKAGITPGTPLKLFRFRVERFREQGAD